MYTYSILYSIYTHLCNVSSKFIYTESSEGKACSQITTADMDFDTVPWNFQKSNWNSFGAGWRIWINYINYINSLTGNNNIWVTYVNSC